LSTEHDAAMAKATESRIIIADQSKDHAAIAVIDDRIFFPREAEPKTTRNAP